MFAAPFRPVALRLPLSEVAALADATARALIVRSPRQRADDLTLAFAFRLQRPAALVRFQLGPKEENSSSLPERVPSD
jgi:hypothetical protein